jgi:hypothetical protein
MENMRIKSNLTADGTFAVDANGERIEGMKVLEFELDDDTGTCTVVISVSMVPIEIEEAD